MATSEQDSRWQQLGRWLRVQRDTAMLSRKEIADLGGPSISTQQQLEDGGRKYRGEWLSPSPDAKTWGRLAAAAGFPLEELRYEGAKAGLWEDDEFPMAEAERHAQALDGDLWINSRGRYSGRPAETEPANLSGPELLAAVRELTEAVRELRADLAAGRQAIPAPPGSDR